MGDKGKKERKMKLFNKRKSKGGLWNATLGELIATFQILEKNGLTLEMLKQLREKGGEEIAKKIIALFLEKSSQEYDDLKKEWQDFYGKYFQTPFDLSAVKIPNRIKGCDRLLIIIPGVSPNKVVLVQRGCFKTWTYTNDLDAAMVHNDREAIEEPYAIWVRDTVEPDQQYRERSANWAKKNNVSGETLLERLIHGLKYWDEKKKQLDINGITLCTGSRHSTGRVPIVSFVPVFGGVRVDDFHPGFAFGHVGLREAVS